MRSPVSRRLSLTRHFLCSVPVPLMQLWHSCTATACGFHACMVAQSIYTPQLQTWATQFSHQQMHVLTLDGFSASPTASLKRVTKFLGLPDFPRMALNRQWKWNQRANGSRVACAQPTLAALAAFFAPHNAHLSSFLARHDKPHAAHAVRAWNGAAS